MTLTTTEKQRRRRAALDTIAQAAGWRNWGEYETSVKRNGVKIAAARANGAKGGRPKKEHIMSGVIADYKPGDVCNIKSRGRWEKDRVTVRTTWYTTEGGRVYTFVERDDLIVSEDQVRKAK